MVGANKSRKHSNKGRIMSLKEEILSVLCVNEDRPYCIVTKIARGFELQYGQEYSSPNLSFEKLLGLSELFGTKAIDVDDYATQGCETCDFGSDYGHTIQIYEPTKNVEEMMQLLGDDLCYR